MARAARVVGARRTGTRTKERAKMALLATTTRNDNSLELPNRNPRSRRSPIWPSGRRDLTTRIRQEAKKNTNTSSNQLLWPSAKSWGRTNHTPPWKYQVHLYRLLRALPRTRARRTWRNKFTPSWRHRWRLLLQPRAPRLDIMRW